MPTIRTEQNSLIGGVSQQPDAIRLPNQGEDIVNCWLSPTEGLTRRPPTVHTTNIGARALVPEKFHTIGRDGAEAYHLVFTPTGIEAWDANTGAAATINTGVDQFGFPLTTPFSYLGGWTDPSDLQLVTVADTTFVVNRTKTVALSSAISPGQDPSFVVAVRAGNYSTTYTATVKTSAGTVTATVQTWDGTTLQTGELASTIPGHLSEGTIATDAISESLRTQLVAGLTALPGVILTTVGSATDSTFFIAIDPAVTIDDVKVSDSVADTNLIVVRGEAPRVAGYLPESCLHGYKVKIVGDAETDGDEYWVSFVGDDQSGATISTGYWEESNAPSSKLRIAGVSAPHILRNTAPGVFQLDEIPWATRAVGDDDLNPFPEFIGRTIANAFFYKNRLGFLYGDRISLSETGEYYTFTRTTLLTLRDSAPIHIQSGHQKPSKFDSAAPYNEDMIIFSEMGQFVLKGGDILSPRTVQLLPITNFEKEPDALPVTTGSMLLFPFRRGAHSGIRELYRQSDLTTYEGADLTSHVPFYLTGRVREIAATSLENTVLVIADHIAQPDFFFGVRPAEESNGVWVYQFLDSARERVQSAWHRWDFGSNTGKVLHVAFHQDVLYLIVKRNNEVVFERTVLSRGLTETGVDWVVHLDGRVSSADYVSQVYDPVADETTITMPYNLSGLNAAVVQEVNGVSILVKSQSTNTVVVAGDVTSLDTYCGINYETRYDFSRPLVKEQTPGGGVAAYSNIPQQVRYLNVHYNGTKHFEVDVTVGNRATRTSEFTGLNTDYTFEALDTIEVHDGTYRAPVLGSADETRVSVRTATPYPLNISHASWEISYRPRASKFRG